jgi:hypothetical protein
LRRPSSPPAIRVGGWRFPVLLTGAFLPILDFNVVNLAKSHPIAQPF